MNLSIKYSKNKIFLFLILNYLFRNLQEFRKILKLKLKLKTQILKKFKTQTFEYLWVHMSVQTQKSKETKFQAQKPKNI
jgi:hypothetical protein